MNLAIGASHFGGLVKLLDNLPKALMAYNAGLSRVRRWEEAYGDLPADLFIEAIPFAETRNYVRKILVSAVAYGHLYQDLSAGEIVRLLLPRLSGSEQP